MDKELELLYGQIPGEPRENEESEEFDDSYYDFIQSLVTKVPEEPQKMPWEMEDIPFDDVIYDFAHPKIYPDDGFIYLNTVKKAAENGSVSYEITYYSCGDFTENIYTILNGKFDYDNIPEDLAAARAVTEALERLPRQINIDVYTDSQALLDVMEKLKTQPVINEDSLDADYKELLYAMYCSNVTFSGNSAKDAFESWEKCLEYVQEREE